MDKSNLARDSMPDLETYLKQTSALELARRSLIGAPVLVVISLIMLIGTPMLIDYGWWAAAEAALLIMLGVVRVWFALGFERRYELVGEKAVSQFSILTALQSLTLGVLAAMVIHKHWASQEVVLTVVLSAGVIAASTSALSVRQSARLIFLACVLGPFGVALFMVGGVFKATIILGYLVLMAFLVQDGGQAREANIRRMREHHSHHGERIKAENELRKLALVIEQSPESIVITNLDSEIEYVNDAFIRTTGYPQNEVIGKNPRFKQSGKTPEVCFRAMWAALSKGQSWKGELHNQRKDGSELIEMALITPLIQPDGTITHYVGIQEDITEKKQLEEELNNYHLHLEELVEQRTEQLAEAQQKAEAANQAKSIFLANMSHEIRTPMTAIIGLIALLRQDKPRPEQALKMASINTASEDLLSIINDILDISRIEAGKLDLNPTNFHLGSIFDHIQSLLGRQAKSKGLTLEVDQTNAPNWLWGDSIRLRQALLNLANNALKFTEQGTITLRIGKVEESGDEMLVRFEVEDTGIGIKPDELDGLFEAFEQATDTILCGQGTGLGLSITRHLAQLMGGEAGAISTLGVGSTFWFTARLRRGQAIESVIPSTGDGAEQVLRTHHQNSTILVVEDNAINFEVALIYLEALGMLVDRAENGFEAVAMSRANTYDLILMDIQMPLMNGLEATREIRSMSSNTNVPIVALTANIYEEDCQAYLEAGMDDVIAKPFETKQFYSTLAKWLAKPEKVELPETTGKSRHT